MRPLDVAAVLTAVFLWGLNFSVGKICLEQIPPILMMTLRFALVALLLAPFLRIQEGRMGRIVAVACTLAVHFCLMFAGLERGDAGPSAIALQLYVPFSALLAWLFFKEKLSAWQVGGMAVAFAGVYILAGEPRIAPRLVPLLMVVGAAFALAAATVQIKKLGPVSIFTLNAWIGLLAAPQLLVATWLMEENHMAVLAAADWRGWGGVVYNAVGATIMAHGLLYYLVGKYPVNRVVPAMLLVPVLAVFLALWILDETLTPAIAAGGVITITGVAVIQLYRPRRGDTEVPVP